MFLFAFLRSGLFLFDFILFFSLPEPRMRDFFLEALAQLGGFFFLFFPSRYGVSPVDFF